MNAVDSEIPPLEMIDPPAPGHRIASGWLTGGVVFYFVVGAVFSYSIVDPGSDGASISVQEFFGLGSPPNYSIALLVGLGIVATVVAFGSAILDLLEIRKEESDIDWLIRYKHDFAQLVLAPTSERDQLRRSGQRTIDPSRIRIETLVDDRVRRVMSTQGSARSAMVPVEELRVIAQTRTARLGSFARYASSLLLLLAVLGTFAGVKTALPDLIEAVTASSATAGTALGIEAPLRAVADAFGANALALIGAIAVGLMAHGISVGRRNLLERLELVSAEYIYGARQMESTDPLRVAVEVMRETIERVRETTGSLLGIESGLTGLGQQFTSAFDSLDDRLTTIVERQDERLHERTSQTLEELREQVAGMTVVLDANTRAYSGLVDRIGERSEEARRSIQQLENANELLAKGLEGAANLGPVADRTRESVVRSIEQLESSSTEIRAQVADLSAAVAGIVPALSEVHDLIAGTVQQVSQVSESTTHSMLELNERAAGVWANAGRELEQHLSRRASGNGQATLSAESQSTNHLLQQIKTTVDSPAPQASLSQQLLIPTAGVVAGGVILYALYAFIRSDFIAGVLALFGVG